MSAPMIKGTRPARNVPPGAIIRGEIETQGWSQRRLAEVMGRPVPFVRDLVNGRRELTPKTALQLEAALEISAETWLRMETAYRLRLAQDSGSVDLAEIRRRSHYDSVR